VNQQELWDLFSLKNEYNPVYKDIFNRNTFWASQNANIFKPVVSEYIIKQGFAPIYPDNKPFALCLTHDIDVLYDVASWKRHTVNIIKNISKLNIYNQIKYFKSIFSKKITSPFHISNIINIEKKYNARSSFYFLSLLKGEVDYNYDVNLINELYELIKANNCEIGLHGGHNAFNNLNKIIVEKARLEMAAGTEVIGYRNHYLKFELHNTWNFLEKADLKYDTTLGYADCAGFRNGMCHPFYPFNLESNCFMNIMELPLNIMDGSLSFYMRMDFSNKIKLIKELIDETAKNKGVLTILWHNSGINEENGVLYNEVLKYAFEKNAWLTSAGEVVKWYKKNKYDEEIKLLLSKIRIN